MTELMRQPGHTCLFQSTQMSSFTAFGGIFYSPFNNYALYISIPVEEHHYQLQISSLCFMSHRHMAIMRLLVPE